MEQNANQSREKTFTHSYIYSLFFISFILSNDWKWLNDQKNNINCSNNNNNEERITFHTYIQVSVQNGVRMVGDSEKEKKRREDIIINDLIN